MEAGFAAHNLAFWRKRRLTLTSPSDPLAFPGPSRDPLATPPGAPPARRLPPRRASAPPRDVARLRTRPTAQHRSPPPARSLPARPPPPPAPGPPPAPARRPGAARRATGARRGGGCQRAVTGQKHPGLRRIRAARSRFWPKIPRFTRFRLRQVRKTQCFWPEIRLSARAWSQRDRRLSTARPPPACALVAPPSPSPGSSPARRLPPPACAPTLTRRLTESASSACPPPRARPLVFLVGKFPSPSRAPAPAIL